MALLSGVVTDFVSESTNSMLSLVIRRIGQEITLAWRVNTELQDLEHHLKTLDAILWGGSSQTNNNNNNRALYQWLKRVREVVYLAEDILDEHSYQVLNRNLAQCQSRRQRYMANARVFFSVSSNPIKHRFQMGHKLKSLRESIDGVYQEAQNLGFRPGKVAGGNSYVFHTSGYQHTVLMDTSLSLQREFPDTKVLLGRDQDKQDVIRMIREASSSNQQLSVIGVHGTPGRGKTTLCKIIFDEMEVGQGFQERIWICVSHDCDLTQMLNHMAEQIGDKQGINSSSIHVVTKKLKERMEGKKLLLVLDDVWETFEKLWEPFKSCLQSVVASNGNTVVVTSRDQNTLASMITTDGRTPHTHKLRSLSEEDSWSLLTRCIGENHLSNPTKKNAAKKMLRKCEGVPLAIKALGGLLRSQNSPSQWEQIEQDQNKWSKEDVHLPSVKLSFKYLPSIQLKRCFAYCAIFKEDEVIDKDQLIQLWMSQGLLNSYNETEQLLQEPLGEQYFHILLNYSLFQVARFNVLGKVEACRMHDTVHSLAQNISTGHTEVVEHRSLHLHANLQSAKSFDKIWGEIVITKTKSLRALILVGFRLEELPDSIGELKHLRYLEISGNMIQSLPNGLSKLYHLQTLRIASNVDLDSRLIRFFPMFPPEFTKLASLRHICTDVDMQIPVGLGMLTCLQTLPPLDLDNHYWGGRVSELEHLCNLMGRLELKGLKDAGIIGDLKKGKLWTKKNIETLVLKFYSQSNKNEEDTNHVRMLEALEPHRNLTTLDIHNYQSSSLPDWTIKMKGYGGAPLDGLVSLDIKSCPVLEHLPSMKNLSALKVLKISNCYKATTLQYLGRLTSLQHLQLYDCYKLENLPDVTPLVCLKVLRIVGCRNMSILPSGLSELPKLETLVISRLSSDVSLFPFPSIHHGSPLSGSLQTLRIDAGGMDKVVDLPSQIRFLCQLKHLEISSFSSMKQLPYWIGNLTSMKKLMLYRLPLVQHLPSLPSQLMALHMWDCPLLDKSCNIRGGPEYFKIQKIPHLDTPSYFR